MKLAIIESPRRRKDRCPGGINILWNSGIHCAADMGDDSFVELCVTSRIYATRIIYLLGGQRQISGQLLQKLKKRSEGIVHAATWQIEPVTFSPADYF